MICDTQKKSLRLLLIGTLLAVTSLAGCSTTPRVDPGGKVGWDQDGARILIKNIEFNDSSMSKDIEIVDIKSAQAGDLMKAQVFLRSKNSDTMNIQYAFAWFDAQGMSLGNTAWKPFIIYAKDTKPIQGVAPDPRANEFKLKVKGNDE